MACRIDDVGEFATESIRGFVQANPGYVKACPGGVIRPTRSRDNQVALVIGGGMGHYPAFAGLVGPGMAQAAVQGNIFASPSARQVVDVCRRADQGRGIILIFGNYEGDRLNFNQAARTLRAEGHDVRVLPVTDDLYSAPPDRIQERRGIAGDMAVFKIAGAACAAGMDLDSVEALAMRANACTRSLGVAFSGCTLPGSDKPLFSVPEGRMSLGLGIHGEPGIGQTDPPTIDGLADLLVRRLMDERPVDRQMHEAHVAPILNGLGALKSDELFAVYDAVQRRLSQLGLRLIQPLVGEFCTSFDMNGLSLSLCWLDEELEPLWCASAETPALHLGDRTDANQTDIDAEMSVQEDGPTEKEQQATPESKQAAQSMARIMQTVMQCVDDNVDYLGRIDAVAGDGDHGLGMQRGAEAASKAADEAIATGSGCRTALKEAAEAWADKAGGTSGALWGELLASLAGHLSDSSRPGKEEIAEGWRDADKQLMEFGGAKPGDKTMVDAVHPFVQAFASCGDSLANTWSHAAEAARHGAEETADMLPKKGRAKAHGSKDLGTPDPGAVSFAMIVQAVSPLLKDLASEEQCNADKAVLS